jgi:hypothetical protein
MIVAITEYDIWQLRLGRHWLNLTQEKTAHLFQRDQGTEECFNSLLIHTEIISNHVTMFVDLASVSETCSGTIRFQQWYN